MRKRKVRSEISETLIRKGREDNETVKREEEEKGGGFFACYLLTSLCPRFKGHTYIGFTVNPRRRIRQHNGEIRCGAWRTKSKRPWEMVLCIYGFPTNVAALQFEWAWQHPIESLAVRKAAVNFKSLSGIANKIKLAYTMLTLPAWQSFNLTINFFSSKYTNHSAGCPSLPEHMKVQVRSMDELPCYTGGDRDTFENDEWENDEECDATGGADGSLKEGVHDSPYHQNREDCETGGAYGFRKDKIVDATEHGSAGHWNGVEEMPEWLRYIEEENGLRQPGDSPIQREDHRQPFCLNDSPDRTLLSSFAISSASIVETIEDRGDMFQGVEEGSVELEWATRKQLPTTMAADKDQSPNKIPTVIPCDIEVIDVFTPSPSYKVRSRSKKRGLSTACTEIIDLTKSPIFV